jgi:hypothetical protein
MTKTNYKNSVASPFQNLRSKSNAQSKRHPADDEVLKNTGVINLTAIVEVDTQTLNLLNNPNIVAFLCTLKQGDQVLGQGRGMSIFSETNKYIAKTVKFASNSSILDAVAKSVKLDFIQLGIGKKTAALPPPRIKNEQVEENSEDDDAMSEKQRNYLLKLIESNITDETERTQLESELDTYSRSQASLAIQALVNH